MAHSIGGHSEDYCTDDACGEGSLDIQYIMAISQSPTTYYYTDSDPMQFVIDLASTTSPPLVISISYVDYGLPSLSVSNAFNVQALKLSAMGVTLVAASGDDGAPGQIIDTSHCSYNPDFMSTSPYVLSIGATKVRSCYECTCNC